jgi:outer membrane immunogenic protein
MKKSALTLLISTTIFGLAFAGPESLPSGKEMKEIAPQPVPPSCSFDGWYIGIHGAATFEESDNHTFTHGQVSEVDIFVGDSTDFADSLEHGGDSTGGFGGVQFGRNFQFGAFVVGLEADFSFGSMEKHGGRAAIDVTETLDEDVFLTAETTTSTQLNWYGTLRPRLGVVFWNNRVMAFGTGGLAVGQADFSVHTDIDFEIEGTSSSASIHRSGDEDVRVGWTVGGGLEFCLSRHISLNFTYLYIDLGDENTQQEFGPVLGEFKGEVEGVDFVRASASSNLHYHVFQGGINFKF